MSKMPKALRLDRLLANLGYGSRREIQQLTKAGHVVLDGATLKKADQRVTLTSDLPGRLSVSGEPVDPPPGMALMMNKPLGVTCSHKEAGALVYGLLPERWRRRDPVLSTIGRLDKETSGLLLFTDDGDLLHRVISPRKHVSKRYHVTLARPFRGDEAEIFSAGTLMLEGEDKPLLPAFFVPLTENTCHLTIHEGRYHQVRRMFAAIENHVSALRRDRIGGLALPDDLAEGEFWLMRDEQIAAIFAEDASQA